MPAPAESNPTITRNDVLALSAGGDSYRFLAVGLEALRQLPQDVELRLQVLRHYAMLGLVGPALEIADGLPDAVRRQPDIEGAIRQLRSVPDGRVPWGRFVDRFERNLAALAERQPDRAALAETWRRARPQLDLYQCRDGNYQLSRLDDRGERVWLPMLTDHKRQSESTSIPRNENELMPSPYLFTGIGLGWLLIRVMEATRKTFLHYRPAIYLLEPNPLALAVALHLHEAAEFWADPRLKVYAGPDCGQRFEADLHADAELPTPNYCIQMVGWGPPLDPPAATHIEAVQRARESHAVALLAEVRSTYDGRDAGYWARRFTTAGADDPLRVLLAVSRHTTYLKYAMRDIARAFEHRGLRTKTITEATDYGKLSAITYLRAFREFQPDLVFIIDHFRREYAQFMPADVPFVGWIQDVLPNLYCREAGESFGPLDFFIAPGLTEFVEKYAYPASQGLAWTTTTDDRLYSDARMSDDELTRYRCDVSFVSNQSRDPAAFHRERRESFRNDPSLYALTEPLFARLRRELQEQPRTALANAARLLRLVKEDTGLAPPTPEAEHALFNYYLFPLGELLFRQHTLGWVADYCDRTGRTLALYGNGWDKHPRFAKYARGFAENGQELRAIYQASAINLQITTYGAVHQRLLDGLAAGGFFLLRYRPIDVIQEPAERFLAAVERYNPQPDVIYPAAEVPELAEAIFDLRVLDGVSIRRDWCRVSTDLIARYRELRDAGYRQSAGAIFPQYGQVAFGTAGEFEALAERYLSDPALRASVAAGMRDVVIGRFSCGALVDALLAFLRKRLAESSA